MSHFKQSPAQLFNLMGHSFERGEFINRVFEIGDYQFNFSRNTDLDTLYMQQNALYRFHLHHFCQPQVRYTEVNPAIKDQVHKQNQEVTGFLDAKYSHFKVKASLLDRPLVFALERALYVPPLSQIQLSLSRPIAFEMIAHNAQDEFKLLLNPTRRLRLTSYGRVTQPMICYH